MKLRNNIFAAAFDYLKRNTDIKTQKELARRMGVTESTITRILRDYVDVTEDIITKLQTASGCIFNLQWLRGEDAEHMLAIDLIDEPKHTPPPSIEPSSVLNAALSAQMESIAILKQRVEELKEQHQRELAEKDARIADLQQLADERLHRISELRRLLDAADISESLGHFPVGVAESKIK